LKRGLKGSKNLLCPTLFMNVKKTSQRARQPKRQARASAVHKLQPKSEDSPCACGTLVGSRLIRQASYSSLAAAPVLE
jgi:hypothetical protein